jgi:hypothetical protein
VGAQEPATVPQQPPPQQQVHAAEAPKNAAAPCVEPPPVVSLKDYNGPLKKAVGVFGRALERKSVHPPHYKPGVVLCSLERKDKFVLFVQDSFDPVAFLSSGFGAGQDQASNRDPTFGQGAAGYGKRFARTSRGRHHQSSSRILPIPRFFPKTHATTVLPRYGEEAFSSCGRTRVRGAPRGRHAHAELLRVAGHCERCYPE